MRPTRQTLGAVAVSAPIVLDTYRDPFNVGIGVALSAGASLTYKVQHTLDDVLDGVTLETFSPATATWYDNAVLVAKTTSSDGNYAYPVTAIRLNVTIWASGTATMTVIQAGAPGS